MKIKELNISVDTNVELKGNLSMPAVCNTLVYFSHGSGSSRFSSRNRMVSEILNKNNIATLLVDLLTEQEDVTHANRFDISLLSNRLVSVITHCSQLAELTKLPAGCFGASTGAASALIAAARLPEVIRAVVSRGGRPDLAGSVLHAVKSPTLLIVGSRDTNVLKLNKEAFAGLQCEKELKTVEGATHLFEEPGKLSEVAQLAADWFNSHLITKLISL